MKKSMRNMKKQRGISLVDFLLWLGLALLALGGITAVYKSSGTGSSTMRTVQETQGIISGVKSASSGGSGYGTGSLNSAIIAGGYVPSTMTVSGTNITNGWGGAVVVTGATTNFTISEASVPKDVCVRKLAQGGDPSVTSIQVGTNAAVTPPLTLAAAATECAAASNTIVWTAS